MRPVPVAIFLQRGFKVLGGLPFQLGHAVVWIGLLVTTDALASEAGIGDLLASRRITLEGRLLGRHRSAGNAEANSRGDEHTRTHPGTKPLKRHLSLQTHAKTAPNGTVSSRQMPPQM